MRQRTQPYVVRQGDYIQKIAARLGVPGDDIWNDPANASLLSAGRTPDTLHPGDILRVPVVPDRSCPLDLQSTNRYAGSLPSSRVEILFRQDGIPLHGQRYEVRLADTGSILAASTTDNDGRVTAHVPVSADEIDVIFPDAGLYYAIAVGHIDPITERSGQIERLRQLGYLTPPTGAHRGVSPSILQGAVRRFQRDQGLDDTGECDAATQEALVRAYGK